jgi:ribonucleoside-triphosphate reductase
VYKGKIWDGQDAPLQTYGMFEKENRLLFKSLMEVMLEGDYKGKPFTSQNQRYPLNHNHQNMKSRDEIAFPDDYPSIRELYLLSFS